MKKSMSVLVAALAATAALAPQAAAQEPTPMVVGGEVDQTPDAEWIAALNFRGRFTCTGSLVAPAMVLTAAHCTAGTRARQWVVRIGSKDRTAGGEVRRVQRIRTYPKYRLGTVWGDMALLRLRRPVPIEPIGLVTRGTHWIGEPGFIAGWGQTSARNHRSPRLLHSAWIPIQPDAVCVRAYTARLFSGHVMLCAGNRRPASCMGDSGGPLARSLDGAWHLVGVTSFGKRRCNRPAGYAWVGSRPLRGWLRKWLGS